MTQQEIEVLPDDMWREYREIFDETTSTGRHVEVEIWHHGHATYIWAPIRRISRRMKDGVAIETWESMTKRDVPVRFSVVLAPGERLESHMEDTKLMGTEYGSKLIMWAGNGGMLGLEALLMALILSGAAISASITDWFIIAPIAAVGTLLGTLALMNRISTAKRITIECACPEDEASNHHLGYILHSKTANVLEQVNAYDRHKDLFKALVDAIGPEISSEKGMLIDRCMQKEAELDHTTSEVADRVSRNLDRSLLLRKKDARSKLDLRLVAAAVVAIGVVVSVLIYMR